MKNKEQTFAQIILPQIVAYPVGAITFIAILLFFAWVVFPAIDYCGLKMESAHQKVAIVVMLLVASVISMCTAGFCGAFVHRLLTKNTISDNYPCPKDLSSDD